MQVYNSSGSAYGAPSSSGGSSGGGGSGGGGWGAFGSGMMKFGSVFVDYKAKDIEIHGWKDYYQTQQQLVQMEMAERKKQTQWQIDVQRLQGRKLLSQARYAFGYAGVKMEGTPTDVMTELKTELELDERMVRREGEVAQQFLQQQARLYRKAEKQMDKAHTLNDINGMMQAVGTLFTMG